MDSNRRSASPDRRPAQPRRPKELSFYKKSSSSSYSAGAGGGAGGGGAGGAVGSFSSRRDPLDRLDDKRRGLAAGPGSGVGSGSGGGEDVPERYGGSRGDYRDRGSSSYSSSRRREDGYQDRDRRRDAPTRGGSGYGNGYGSRRDDDYGRDRDRGSDRKYGTSQDDEPTRGEYKGGEPLRRVPTRDERDENGNSAYRGGGELRRVETRNEPPARPAAAAAPVAYGPMIEIIANDRLGRKVRVKCLPSDTVGDLKKLIAAQTGTIASKIQLKKWYTTYKDHITLRDYEIHDGMSLEMY